MIDNLEINFKRLKEKKERNRLERIKFIDMYAEWMKKTPNDIWSKHHADFIDSGIAIARRRRN